MQQSFTLTLTFTNWSQSTRTFTPAQVKACAEMDFAKASRKQRDQLKGKSTLEVFKALSIPIFREISEQQYGLVLKTTFE